MSDRDTIIQDEIELITDYLNRRLDPARAEAVYQRLEQDPEFLELAAPLLFAWSVKPEWERAEKPGEAEKHWDEFTRRADFAHHRRRRVRRNWWIVGILFVTLGLPGFWFQREIRVQVRDWRDYARVAPDTGWTRLRDHIQYRLGPGARLRAGKPLPTTQRVKLDAGSARFRVELTDTTHMSPAAIPIVVFTRAGEIVSAYGDFTVTVRGDTTIVEEHEPARQRYLGFMPFPSMTLVKLDDVSDPVRVETNERVRLVRGQPLERLP